MASTTEVAPIIVTALFGRQDTAFFDAMRREHFPPERNQLDSHLTLFHHLPPSGLDELKHRLNQETRGLPAPRARIGGLMSLGRG
ncbi:MAG: 2'-5' RNA ligase family protein, partial [Sphingomonas sp.]